MEQVAVVTGANRGLGLEVSRELVKKGCKVVLTSRDPAKGEQARKTLASEGLAADFYPLDVTSNPSIDQLTDYLEKTYGRLDILVNNAGILPDREKPCEFQKNGRFSTSVEVIRKALESNTLGPFQLCQKFIPLMLRHHYGRIVNVSSGMGQLSEMNAGWPAYRISKTALNAVTRIFSEETKGTGILVNSVCPGWVRTDMGGSDAHRSIPEGADTIVWLATLAEGGPTGGFFRDRKPLPW